MNSKPKGRKTFSSRELNAIREMIIQKCKASREEQKSIRKTLRSKFDFYITDFTVDITSAEEFDKLCADGTIGCSDKDGGDLAKLDEEIKAPKSISPEQGYGGKENHKAGMAPIVGSNPEVLILGTLPGDQSLMKQEYYSQAGNRFWKIVYGIFGEEDVDLSYGNRIEFLKAHGIAVWDVLSHADRTGSLDTNITQEMPNDIRLFLNKYPTIKTIAFNGKKAAELFSTHHPHLLEENGIKYLTLLSSSGANNQFSFETIKNNWEEIFR